MLMCICMHALLSGEHVRPPEGSRPGQRVPSLHCSISSTLSSSSPPVASPPECPAVRLGDGLEQRARCCELESVTSITSVQSESYSAHAAGAPPRSRGVNSRSQISRPARLIHHPLSFVWFLLYFILSLHLFQLTQ